MTNNSRDNGQVRKSYLDEASFSSGNSSLSSFSAGSNSTWSLPRSRVASSRRTDYGGAPRRSGSSFRVSLRPSRHARHGSSGGREGGSLCETCCGADGSRYTILKRQVWTVLLGCAMISIAFSLAKPDTSSLDYLYQVYDKLSTEDLVAQGEMSAHANEEAMNMAISARHNPAAAQAFTIVKDEEFTTTTTKKESTAAIAQLDETAANVEDSTTVQVEEISPIQQATNEDTAMNAMKKEGETEPMLLQGNATENENIANAYEKLYKDKIDIGTSDGVAAALRGTRLHIVNDEDRLPPKNDVNGNLDPYNVSATPERLDWSPRVADRVDPLNRTVVAYILPIYQCYRPVGQVSLYGLHEPANDREFHDAALMLQASIHKNSIRNPSSGSSYDYEMVALVHRGIQSCDGGSNRTHILQSLGYRVEVVREPIHANNIQSEYLRKHAPRNNGGRAGMREMIRLYAFKMIEYRLNVLIDITSFMLHPADSIYDALLNGPRGHEWAETHPDHIVRDTFYPNGTVITSEQLPTDLDIMFTRDYSSMDANTWTTGLALTFVPIRPSIHLYKKLLKTYQSTTYDQKHGWDNKGYVNYRGSMQTKGLLTYYFSEIHPDRKLELHRCVYNNMADVPFVAGKKGESDNCKDVKEHKVLPDGSNMPCTDCRKRLFDEIVMANYGICQSPWVCPYIADTGRVPLLVPTLTMCRAFHSAWFNLRRTVEETVVEEAKRTKTTGTFYPELFHGYCLPGGERGGSYVKMDQSFFIPDGFGEVHFPPTDYTSS